MAISDPYGNFNFLVELDGIAQASFTDCSGLESTTEIIETREGGDNTTVRKLPGKTSYSDITLKWGLTDSTELWNWRQQIVNGTVVHTAPREGMAGRSDGVWGVRVNHVIPGVRVEGLRLAAGQ